MLRKAIAVIGAGDFSASVGADAYQVGRLIAERGLVLVTGGRTGVMEAASQGARDAGGLVIGILPGTDANEANSAVDVAIPTGMGQLRNGLVVNSAVAVIAMTGGWGTLSEIGLARKLGKPVIGLHTWELTPPNDQGGIIMATDPEDAVERAISASEE